jgi:hypothetical protein
VGVGLLDGCRGQDLVPLSLEKAAEHRYRGGLVIEEEERTL